MKRRSFVKASLASIAAAAATETLAADAKKAGEFYELRTYHLREGKRAALDAYLSKAFIPAVKRLGGGPVGVFAEKDAKGPGRVFVLVIHPGVESLASLAVGLAGDAEHQTQAADYLGVKPDDPVYTRVESSLLAAIEGMPKMEKPDASKPRLFNLRVYESHNERAAWKKVEMFNKGEIAIFRRVGLTPVFFGSAVVGAAMPNLTYMLAFPDDEARQAAWKTFIGDAEWKKLRAIPEYADKEIVSKITNLILMPTAYSQI
jgi:hypothetical protein